MSRKINPGIVVAIFVLGVFAFLLFSQFRSGDLVGEAVGTLDSGIIELPNRYSKLHIDFSQNPPQYETTIFPGSDIEANEKYGYQNINVKNGARIQYLPTGTSFSSVTYQTCAPLLYNQAYSTSGVQLRYGNIVCLKFDNNKYVKILNNDRFDGSALTYAYVKPICGDGLVQGTEQCDDGNTVNDDACSNICKTPTCSDGIKNKQIDKDYAEADVDCGFYPSGCPTECALGNTCTMDGECQSGACDLMGQCVTPALTLNDAVIEGSILKVTLTKNFRNTNVHLSLAPPGSTPYTAPFGFISCSPPYPCTTQVALPSDLTAGSTLYGWHAGDESVLSSVVVTCTDCPTTFNLPKRTSTSVSTARWLDFSANPVVSSNSIALDDVNVQDNYNADTIYAVIDRRSDWIGTLATVNKEFAEVTANDCSPITFVSGATSRGQLKSDVTYCILPAEVGSTKVYKLSLKEATATDWVIQYQELDTGAPLECQDSDGVINIMRGATLQETFSDHSCTDYRCAQNDPGLVANGMILGRYTTC